MMVKSDIVNNVKELASNNKCLVVINYSGVDAAVISGFRGDLLLKCGVKMLVAKNTLFKIATSESDYSKLGKLCGQNGFIFCNDIFSVSKVVHDYCFNKKALKFVSCVSEGEVCDEGFIKEYASLPTLEVVRQKMMLSINSVASSLLYLLSKKFEEKDN